MKFLFQKSFYISPPVAEVLSPKVKGGNELVEIALIIFARGFNQDLMLMIREQGILRPVNPELMQRRVDLGRKGEISRCPMAVGYDYTEFIDNVGFPDTFKKAAGKSQRNHRYLFIGQIFDNFADSVADYVLQQSSRQTARPMVLVS